VPGQPSTEDIDAANIGLPEIDVNLKAHLDKIRTWTSSSAMNLSSRSEQC